MRRILPVLAIGSALALLVVGLGSALNAESPPTESGPVSTTGSLQDGTAQSKWVETQGIRGKAPKGS